MKRKDILRKLAEAGLIIEEGKKHTHIIKDGKMISVVSRQAEIRENIVRVIQKQTGVKLLP